MRNSVVIDTASGRALIGDTLVPVREAGSHGELQVGGSQGPIVHPLTFGERSRVVTHAAGSPAALDILCAGVLKAALLQPGEADRLVQEIFALTLAGADQDAPPFAETALRVARTAGWELCQLYDVEAAEVDRLAVYLGGRPPDSGWTQIVFASGARSLTSVRQELAEQLLRRADPFVETSQDTRTFPVATAPVTQEPAPFFFAEGEPSFVNATSPTEHGFSNAEGAAGLQEPAQRTASSPRAKLTAKISQTNDATSHLRVSDKLSKQRMHTQSASPRSGDSSSSPIRFSNISSRQRNSISAAPPNVAQAVSSPAVSAPLPLQLPSLQRLRTGTAARPAPQVTLPPTEQTLVSAPVRSISHDFPVSHQRDLFTTGDQNLTAPDWAEMADALAELLDQEADMRGLKR